MLRFAAAALAAFLLAQSVRAESVAQIPTICLDGAEARAFLDATGELSGQGLMTDKLIVQLRTKPNGQYSIAILNGAGRACITAIGSDWSMGGDEL